MSPCGTEQTLDLIKRAPTGARARRHTLARAHNVMCACRAQIHRSSWQTDQEGACGSDHLLLGDVQRRSQGARAHAHTRRGLTSSTFCIRNRAVACGKTQTPRCLGLPSCPKVNHHAKLRLTIQTTAALAWTSSYPPKASAAEELTHEQEAEEERSRKQSFKKKIKHRAQNLMNHLRNPKSLWGDKFK